MTENDDILEKRLQNWGRSIMMFRSRHASPLYWMRIEAERAEGRRTGDGFTVEVDYEDAAVVNRAWRRLPEIPERYRLAKRFLVNWYSRPDLRLSAVASRARIRQSELNTFRQFALYLIDKELKRLDTPSQEQ